jgi:LmbE family N-acetylglucosaminyl deacetylase
VSVPAGPLLVISPHFDDAALSCGALIERVEPVTVLDVFTRRPEPEQRTRWDAGCGFSGSHAAMAARSAEEQAAFAGTPHRVEGADLLDGQYLSGLRADADRTRLAAWVDAWLARDGHSRATVVAPVGAGTPSGVRPPVRARLRARRAGTYAFDNSPDHLFARDVVLEQLRRRPEVGLWCYEELPYHYAMDGSRLVLMLERWTGRTAVPHDLPVDRAAKARRIAAYASQLPMLFRDPDPAAIERALAPTERYWELRAH